MKPTRHVLELQLNDFDSRIRREALETLWDSARVGEIELPPQGRAVNLHCHTFFSFNGYGYSPSTVAWKARLAGLAAVGLVDFDVLDGVDEFLSACKLIGLRACAGIETRVFVPEFANVEINSPGEPGIAYFMGSGFVSSTLSEPGLLPHLKEMAQSRTRSIVDRVNPFLSPLMLDYEGDVLPLTPNGNPTERHVCIAYDTAARNRFPDEDLCAAFWADKLGAETGTVKEMLSSPPVFQAFFRSKVMKAGGVGYVKPEGAQFPTLQDVAKFILNAGGIPTYAWLDGTSAGEQRIGELLDLMQAAGIAAVNIIPDRNWNIADAAAREKKAKLMHEFVQLALDRHLPILVGTEINAHGQRFVDDFDAPEMRPLVGPAQDGAMILYGHTLLESTQGMGYVSDWAQARFTSAADKNAFYKRLGQLVGPAVGPALKTIGPEMGPSHVLAALQPAESLH